MTTDKVRGYSFDWDDNILHMPTKIAIDYNNGTEWVPTLITTEMFSKVRENENFKRKARERTLEGTPRSEIEARARRFNQAFGKPTGADPFTGKGTYQTTPTITSFDPETGVTTVTLTKGREIDPITGEIKAK